VDVTYWDKKYAPETGKARLPTVDSRVYDGQSATVRKQIEGVSGPRNRPCKLTRGSSSSARYDGAVVTRKLTKLASNVLIYRPNRLLTKSLID